MGDEEETSMDPHQLPCTQLVLVCPEPAGQFTAQAVGLPELRATAESREEAIRQVRVQLDQWLTSGRLVSVTVPLANPVMKWLGRADPNDPDEQAYLAELARFRQEDLERALQECEQEDRECSDSSSTPIT